MKNFVIVKIQRSCYTYDAKILEPIHKIRSF